MYEAFYKLRDKPFRLSPDPRFFFNSRGHKRALAYLRYGVKQGEGFIIITGDVGTGKTTLVQTLLRSLDKENIVAAQIVTTQLQADDLVRLVAASFGLAYQRVSKATVLKSLEIFFQACVKEGKRVLLIVDEAQALPRKAIEELRMLSNFQMGGRTLLQAILRA
nr:AAA family ATPase [Gammaproteobacteria bacterium]